MGVAKVSQMLVSRNIAENSENLINPKFNASLPVCVWIVWEVDSEFWYGRPWDEERSWVCILSVWNISWCSVPTRLKARAYPSL